MFGVIILPSVFLVLFIVFFFGGCWLVGIVAQICFQDANGHFYGDCACLLGGGGGGNNCSTDEMMVGDGDISSTTIFANDGSVMQVVLLFLPYIRINNTNICATSSGCWCDETIGSGNELCTAVLLTCIVSNVANTIKRYSKEAAQISIYASGSDDNDLIVLETGQLLKPDAFDIDFDVTFLH